MRGNGLAVAAATFLGLGAVGGCVPAQRPPWLDQYDRALAHSLWQEWATLEAERAPSRIAEQIAPVRTALDAAESRLDSVEAATATVDPMLPALLAGMQESLNKVHRALGRFSANSKETVESGIEAARKSVTDELDTKIEAASADVGAKIGAAVARLDALEQGQQTGTTERAELKTDLEDRLGKTERELKSDATTAREALRSDILKPTALQVPIRTILDDWKGTDDIAALKAHNQTLRYVLGGLGALALGSGGLALRPRNQKRLAQAEDKARKAEKAAELARDAAGAAEQAVEALRAEMPKRRTSRAKKKDAGG